MTLNFCKNTKYWYYFKMYFGNFSGMGNPI
jgi:hypothetical protein